MEGIRLALQLLCSSFSAPAPGAVAGDGCAQCVCSLAVWLCRCPTAGEPALRRTMLHPPPCRLCLLLGGCETETQRHSADIIGLEEGASGERSLCPHSPGKLAGKSQAGLRFSASGVLGMVSEVQEEKTIESQVKDSNNHCSPCRARKVLFPPTLQNH